MHRYVDPWRLPLSLRLPIPARPVLEPCVHRLDDTGLFQPRTHRHSRSPWPLATGQPGCTRWDFDHHARARAQFTLRHSDDAAPVTLGVVGEHHLTNALAAASLALSAVVEFSTVAEGLNGAGLVSGSRMEVTERPDPRRPRSLITA